MQEARGCRRKARCSEVCKAKRECGTEGRLSGKESVSGGRSSAHHSAAAAQLTCVKWLPAAPELTGGVQAVAGRSWVGWRQVDCSPRAAPPVLHVRRRLPPAVTSSSAFTAAVSVTSGASEESASAAKLSSAADSAGAGRSTSPPP